MSDSKQDKDLDSNNNEVAESFESTHKVLPFRRRSSQRQLLRYSLSVSLATVFLVALFINQIQFALVQKEIHILAGERLADSNRIPANVRPEEVSAILKEQALAARLDSNSIKVIGSEKVNDVDQLIYGALEGKYRPQFQNGKIKSLELSSNVSPGDGRIIADKRNFLLENRKLLGWQNATVSFLEKGLGYEVFELKDNSKNTSTKVRFSQDEGGHINSIEMIPGL